MPKPEELHTYLFIYLVLQNCFSNDNTQSSVRLKKKKKKK